MFKIKCKIYYFRLLEAYISTNSSEDLQLKAKKGIAQLLSLKIKDHRGQTMICRLCFLVENDNTLSKFASTQEYSPKMYLSSSSRTFTSRRSFKYSQICCCPIFKGILRFATLESKASTRSDKLAFNQIFRVEIIFRCCRTIHQPVVSLSHLAG